MPGSIYDYFVRACRREITIPSERGVSGDTIMGSDGNSARFWIGMNNGCVATVDYGSTSCATLLAICEHITELTLGAEPSAFATITLEHLLELHPEIAPTKQESVKTAVKAFQSAVRSTRVSDI